MICCPVENDRPAPRADVPDPNQQYAYFALAGEFDPAELTARLGVTPTESWAKGDICEATYRGRTESCWKLLSRLGRERDLEDHIRDVLAQLGANPEEFGAASAELGGPMQFVGYFHSDYPGLSFDRAMTEVLAAYHLAVDFNFYGLYSHRREGTA